MTSVYRQLGKLRHDSVKQYIENAASLLGVTGTCSANCCCSDDLLKKSCSGCVIPLTTFCHAVQETLIRLLAKILDIVLCLCKHSHRCQSSCPDLSMMRHLCAWRSRSAAKPVADVVGWFLSVQYGVFFSLYAA